MIFCEKVSIYDADKFVECVISDFIHSIGSEKYLDNNAVETFKQFLIEKIKTEKLYNANFSFSPQKLPYARKTYTGAIRIFYNMVEIYINNYSPMYESPRKRKVLTVTKLKLKRETTFRLLDSKKYDKYLIERGYKILKKYKDNFALPEKDSKWAFIYKEKFRKIMYKDILILYNGRLICILTKYSMIIEYVRIIEFTKNFVLLVANEILERDFGINLDSKDFDSIVRKNILLKDLTGVI